MMMRKRVKAQKRGEQCGEGPAEKQENLGEKLKKVGKRGGHSTPVIPFWRLYHLQHHHQQDQEPHITGAPFVSSRKLAATLWELHHYKLPLSKMQQGVGVPPLARLRRPHRHRHEENTQLDPPDPSPILPELPESVGSLRRHLAASLMQHHRPVERSNHAIQPVSPASFNSSMEVAPYNPAITPSSSTDFKGRIGEGGYSLRTSTELLKVLNRIWSLEEQHVSNMTLVRKLKKELDHAHMRIKELLQEQQADRRGVDELMKQISEDKLVRKSKEQDRINAAVQSVRDELDDERKLRKRSESLHRKLARELLEVKTSFANAVKEVESERKSRKLLEELCDEFAWGISDYEQELHSLRQKSDKEWTGRTYDDRLILHISESWLDERMQMKLQPQHGGGEEENPTVEKLSSEIDEFLRIKRDGIKNNPHFPTYRRSSLESIPLNVAVSAPQDEGDEDISVGSDSHCFELRKASAVDLKSPENEEIVKADYTMQKLGSHERAKGRSPSNMQVKFQEKMAQATIVSKGGNHVEDLERGKTIRESLAEISGSKKSDRCKITEEGSSEKKSKPRATPGLNSNYSIDDLIRSHYFLSECGIMPPENEYGVASLGNSNWRGRASPVRQWTEKLPSSDNEFESSSKLPPDSKEHTLKAKLMDSKQHGQQSRSRLKGRKGYLPG
ncbi:PREDICTED: uncharacterized protein At5g41620-like isoform X2 [Ipomoea nil]|uniref:uncharacterized protein At5g41620-like isoform X2 n=1 Tax=Ipomoea nil TaxID=35883 RepID=UPI00090102AE|nr:PREDICTED: uncharacterized protein At5g41620-like isoform X2 [Ipomoea nil]